MKSNFGPHIAKPFPGTPDAGDLGIGESPLDWKVATKTGDRQYSIKAAFATELLADAYALGLSVMKVECIVLAPVEVWNKAHPEVTS